MYVHIANARYLFPFDDGVDPTWDADKLLSMDERTADLMSRVSTYVVDEAPFDMKPENLFSRPLSKPHRFVREDGSVCYRMTLTAQIAGAIYDQHGMLIYMQSGEMITLEREVIEID